jgi:hypothetical protein
MKYTVTRTFLNFIKGDEVEQERLEKIFHKSYIETLIKDGFLEEIGRELPKTWEDLAIIEGWFVDTDSNIIELGKFATTEDIKNAFPTSEEAEACLALSQLCQLRDRYNNGWKPDWGDSSDKYCIYLLRGKVTTGQMRATTYFLTFKTLRLRDLFLENFRDLIEIAKPLL